MSTKLNRILTMFIIGGLTEVALVYAAKHTNSYCLFNLYLVLYAVVGLPFSFSFACLIGYVSDGEDFTL
jgi:hypothetical protein